MNINDYIFVEAQFFFAPEADNENHGNAISISFLDMYPSFNHKKEILDNFKLNGLVLVDYQITYRPINETDNLDYYNITKH